MVNTESTEFERHGVAALDCHNPLKLSVLIEDRKVSYPAPLVLHFITVLLPGECASLYHSARSRSSTNPSPSTSRNAWASSTFSISTLTRGRIAPRRSRK